MSIAGVKENYNGALYYKSAAPKRETVETFSAGIQEEPVETSGKEQSEIPGAFEGTSFADLFYSGKMKGNRIPAVNQIVSSRNPEDGEIYRTYFTDDKITCCRADGEAAWELEINEKQQQKVKDYFKEFRPYKWAKELYSGDDMGMAAVKNFWLELFEKNSSEKSAIARSDSSFTYTKK